MNELTEVLSNALANKEQAGSDYTARVTRVDGSTAYVQIVGSDIADTPVAMSIKCKPGDMVRVRVSNGKAWITGNDTSPPSDNNDIETILETLQMLVSNSDSYLRNSISDLEGNYARIVQSVSELVIAVGNKMNTDMGNRASSITISQGLIQFLSNTIKINSSNFTLDENGNATFSGTLNSAGGTFKGKMVIDWGSNTTVTIGDPTSTRPIELKNTDGSKMQIYDTGWGVDLSTLGLGYTDCTGSTITLGKGSNMAIVDETGVHTSSDKRLKEEIDECSPDLAVQLRPVRYRFRDGEDIRYGFIAQEVQEILPGAVREHNGYLTINYTDLIAPLLALVKNLETRISKLEETMKGG